jgi:hypothetical protein
VIQHLSSKHQDINSNPNTTKKKEEEEEERVGVVREE